MLNCLSSVFPDCLLDNKAPKLCVQENLILKLTTIILRVHCEPLNSG